MNCLYEDKFYIDVKECILKYTVVMYHIITTDFEMGFYTVLYLLMILLYIYQCYKIHYFYDNVFDPSTKPYGEFQLLLYFLSVFRLLWGTYGILGNYLDYIYNIELPNFVYCDYIFYEEMQINSCFLTYKIIGLLQEVSQFMMNMMVQLLALFWNSDKSPFDIILFKVGRLKYKLLWGFFSIINFIGLAMIIWLTIEQYKQKYVFYFFYYSLAWTALSYLYFLYSWISYRIVNRGNQTDYKVLGVILGLSIIMRTIYLSYRILCDPIEVLYKDDLQILVQGGFIIFCEYLMLFGMIKIF